MDLLRQYFPERLAARLERRLTGGEPGEPLALGGLFGSAPAFVAALLGQASAAPVVLVVVPGNRDLADVERDLRFYCRWFDPEAEVFPFPMPEVSPYHAIPPHFEVIRDRLSALAALARWCVTANGAESEGPQSVRPSAAGAEDSPRPGANQGKGAAPRLYVVASAGALLHRTFSPAELRRHLFTLAAGAEVPPQELAARLDAMGYRRVDIVSSCGEFAVRGGVLDFFPVTAEQPVRLEYFGDRVESLRLFDAESQRTAGDGGPVDVVPAREYLLDADHLRVWALRARRRWTEAAYRRQLAEKIEFLETSGYLPEMDALRHLLADGPGWSLLDHLGEAPLHLVLEPELVEEELRSFWKRMLGDHVLAQEERRICLAPGEMFLDPEALLTRLAAGRSLRLGGAGVLLEETETPLATEEGVRYAGKVHQVAEEAAKSLGGGGRVLMVMRTPGKRDRLVEILREYGLEPRVLWGEAPGNGVAEGGVPGTGQGSGREAVPSTSSIRADSESSTTEASPGETSTASPRHGAAETLPPPAAAAGLRAPSPGLPGEGTGQGGLWVLDGYLSRGFTLRRPPLRLLTDDEVFGAAEAAEKKAERRRGAARFATDFRDLSPGDLIVHADHGIGRFVELKTIEREGGAKDFMVLEYRDADRLLVPLERLDLVQKFSGVEGGRPTLDRLGGQNWQKVKARVKKSMQDMARELLNLYASRQLVRGYPFSPDTEWQREFEGSFEFDETPDQRRAIEEVKADLERPKPMDRLICGDVGYGKTEVAMRAAFKCVMDGKQVALLAPTTVLAYQHFHTLSRRLAPFPVKVELLSRFRSAAEQKRAIKALAAGEVDVIVGTHRLLSQDVEFRDLGLLVVDEEQRFGVGHKEKLKRLRRRVDVLTMSATPIPRTLNMALLGARDMSVIETPPRNRLSIHTNVVPFRGDLIASAIRRELERQGQVYFVHNRVASILAMAAYVRRLVPEARVAIAHGQMREKELEGVMLKFIDGATDVLVSSAIIENGLDIPRVNTLLVNRADRFGLSQLYQLRGRVGRSDRRAFAYLLVPAEQALDALARKRLAALREFSDLGSGFRIAALDLELRGAGNLLGREQHGHVAAIGFELYSRLLRQAVAELKGEDLPSEVRAAVNIAAETHVPEGYIPEANLRLSLHKRLASVAAEAELEDLLAEIEDRFGPPPEPLRNLVELARLRLRAEALGIESLESEGGVLAVKFSSRPRIDGDKLIALLHGREDVSFDRAGVLKVRMGGARPPLDEAAKLLAGLG